MCLLVDWLKASRYLVRTAHRVLWDSLRLVALTCRSRSAVEAENLFLRKQLALFQERNLRPHRADDSTRWLMSFLSQWFDWRNALVVVKQPRLSHRPGLPPPEQMESFAMPSDQCLWLNDHQSVAPVEPLAQKAHQPASGIVGAMRSEIALLEQGQLFA